MSLYELVVCNIEDSYRCFMVTELDMLAYGNFILYKGKQKNKLVQDYKNKFDND